MPGVVVEGVVGLGPGLMWWVRGVFLLFGLGLHVGLGAILSIGVLGFCRLGV